MKVGTLECSSDARPAASIVWTKAGEEIATGRELTFSGSISRWRHHLEKQRGGHKRLKMIDVLNREQAGVYKCQAENIHGKAESELTVDVLFRPSCFVSQVC